MTTAIRSLLRHKQYTLINILGLAVGLAASILILLYVDFELSYDRWIPENDRVMRIETLGYNDAGELVENDESVPGVAAGVFGEQVSDIELYARFYNTELAMARDGEAFEQNVTLTDPDIFELMGIQLIEGDPATALSDPLSIVLSATDARRIFGDASPMGQVIKVDGKHLVKVSGVMPDWPVNSDLGVDALMPVVSPVIEHTPWVLKNWGSFWGPTYIRMKPGVPAEQLAAQLNELALRVGPDSLFQTRVEQGLPPAFVFHLTKAQHAHLSGGTQGSARSSVAALWIAGLIAFLILAIAVINVANLGTMLAMKRVREVAIRKSLGAEARHLMMQVLLEAVALTYLSLVVGVAIAELVLPTFSDLMNRDLTSHLLYRPATLAGLLLGTFLVGLVCGLYPALVAVRFRPVDYLTGIKPRLGARLRNILIVLQFAATIGLLVTCFVVFLQAEYARSNNKGYETARMISIDGIDRPITLEREAALRAALSRVDGVEGVAATHGVPGYDYNNRNRVRADNGEQVPLRRFAMSEDLMSMLGVTPLAGRLFSRDYPSDAVTQADRGASRAIILNDLAVHALGYENPQDAIGRKVYTWGDFESTIVGVVPNMRTRSAREAPSPTYYWIGPHEYRHIVVKVRAAGMADTLAAIDRTWREFFPDLPIRRQFVDDAFADYYDNDRRQGWLLLFSATVMTIIAVMGLYGLAALVTERRAKEIGIRKVLGAKSLNIVQLLLWQFSLPVLVANLIAWPIAWWALSGWLESFIDRIGLSPLPFLAAGVLVLGVAWATIAGHTLKVARRSPVKALRYE
jgi:putative ABC transport system permease protein